MSFMCLCQPLDLFSVVRTAPRVSIPQPDRSSNERTDRSGWQKGVVSKVLHAVTVLAYAMIQCGNQNILTSGMGGRSHTKVALRVRTA